MFYNIFCFKMKYFFLFKLVIALVSWYVVVAELQLNNNSTTASSFSKINEEVNKVIKFIKSEKEHLHNVLEKFGNQVHEKLFVMFPELQKEITEIETEMHNIRECYNEEIDHRSNRSVHIFEDNIHTVVVKFFESNGHILKGLDHQQIKNRVDIFIKNLSTLAKLIIKCVKDKKQNNQPTMKFGLTMMQGYSPEEIKTQILNSKLGHARNESMVVKPSKQSSIYCNPQKTKLDTKALPANFSWLEKGYVSPVLAQGKCMDCYIFAATSGLESQYMIRAQSKLPVQFSIQRTLDCLKTGCNGGYTNQVNDYFRTVGASLEGFSKYKGSSNISRCKTYPTALKADVTCHHFNLKEEQLQRLLVRSGPIIVTISAIEDEMFYLKDSPYYGPCNGKLNHAVLLVGYTDKFFIIKNSWGATWGKKGYLYLPRGGKNDNKCGVRKQISAAYLNPFNN